MEEGSIIIDVQLAHGDFDKELEATNKSVDKLIKKLKQKQKLEKAQNKDKKGGMFSGLFGGKGKGGSNDQKGMFKTLAKYAIGLDLVKKAFGKVVGASKEAFDWVVLFDKETYKNVSNISNKFQQLANQTAAMVAPLVNMFAPVLTQLLDYMNELAVKFSRFVAALNNQKTFIKATEVQRGYAAALKKTQDNLTGLDEINKFQTGNGGFTNEELGDVGDMMPAIEQFRKTMANLKEDIIVILDFSKKLADQAIEFFGGLDLQPLLDSLGFEGDGLSALLKGIGEWILKMNDEYIGPFMKNLIEVWLPDTIDWIECLIEAIKLTKIAAAKRKEDRDAELLAWGEEREARKRDKEEKKQAREEEREANKRAREEEKAARKQAREEERAARKEEYERKAREIKEYVENVKERLAEGIENFKEKWQEGLENVKEFAKGVVNKLIDFLNGIVSGAATAFNFLIDGINKLKIKVPDWDIFGKAAGSSLGFDLKTWSPKKIPYLASGAVIPPNAPFTAVLGDQKSGTNIETPEDLLRKIVREESGSRGGSYEFVAQINRRTLFDEMIAEAKLRQQTTGRDPFLI